MAYYHMMFLKGWFLLATFLLMQVGSLVVSACQPGTEKGVQQSCAALACCCRADQASESPACVCAPASNERPAPAVPLPSPSNRDLLTAPVWVDVRTCGLSPKAGPDCRSVRASLSTPAATAAVTVALTVRFCAFLI